MHVSHINYIPMPHDLGATYNNLMLHEPHGIPLNDCQLHILYCSTKPGFEAELEAFDDTMVHEPLFLDPSHKEAMVTKLKNLKIITFTSENPTLNAQIHAYNALVVKQRYNYNYQQYQQNHTMSYF